MNEEFSTRGKSFYKKGGLFSKDKTFDGKLIALKRIIRKTKEDIGGQNLYAYHTFTIQKGHSEIKYVFKGSEDMDFTGYFEIGELVRHHVGYEIPEKQNKSKDANILCIVCGEFNDLSRGHCPYCGAVLLK